MSCSAITRRFGPEQLVDTLNLMLGINFELPNNDLNYEIIPLESLPKPFGAALS